ncbi:type II toxin-antitoxin system Phd/YefM family antitoxin [Rickettsiales endosymbiont of Peranema trichophorum]|uniref:type II toxin-antitoxin system Phd/YefM family antitoxin n=1 Tax=Rickettsiales endosymbiont of Peranema trichophorum TaxID=2486577 RepID=UPI001023551E|nr:type II toxin-antitoxin system Phd/YefM family antitoxin [Rickettsiales endosymbiont of Peranema trichophorum]RZI47260.1 type II toxin-antitoxin system Phd/YefM family antitoxin [Rickettsiales endosymbiont of Peranema trichophorum]
MEIYTTSQARHDLFKLVDSTNQTHQPVYIVGKRNEAVLLSKADYEAMVETIHIMSVPGLKESILEMNNKPLEEYSEDVDL